jgi:hypothetical protein
MKNLAHLTLALSVFMFSSIALADPVTYLCTFRAGPDVVSSIAVTNDGTDSVATLGTNRSVTINIKDLSTPFSADKQVVTVALSSSRHRKGTSPYMSGTITTGQDMFQFLAQTTADNPGHSDLSLFCQN